MDYYVFNFFFCSNLTGVVPHSVLSPVIIALLHQGFLLPPGVARHPSKQPSFPLQLPRKTHLKIGRDPASTTRASHTAKCNVWLLSNLLGKWPCTKSMVAWTVHDWTMLVVSGRKHLCRWSRNVNTINTENKINNHTTFQSHFKYQA